MAINKEVQMYEVDPTKRYLFTLIFDDTIDANDDFCEMHRRVIREAMKQLGCSSDNIRFVTFGYRKDITVQVSETKGTTTDP